MLRPAGFSSGRGDCARGGMFCGAVRFCRNVFRPVHAGHAFLLGCFSFVLCRSYVSIGMFFVCLMPVIRSYRYVLRSITPAVCRIAPNRTACDMLRSYSAVGRDRHSCVLGCRVVIRRCWFTSGLRVFWRRSRRDYRGRWVTELAARPLCVFA